MIRRQDRSVGQAAGCRVAQRTRKEGQRELFSTNASGKNLGRHAVQVSIAPPGDRPEHCAKSRSLGIPPSMWWMRSPPGPSPAPRTRCRHAVLCRDVIAQIRSAAFIRRLRTWMRALQRMPMEARTVWFDSPTGSFRRSIRLRVRHHWLPAPLAGPGSEATCFPPPLRERAYLAVADAEDVGYTRRASTHGPRQFSRARPVSAPCLSWHSLPSCFCYPANVCGKPEGERAKLHPLSRTNRKRG